MRTALSLGRKLPRTGLLNLRNMPLLTSKPYMISRPIYRTCQRPLRGSFSTSGTKQTPSVKINESKRSIHLAVPDTVDPQDHKRHVETITQDNINDKLNSCLAENYYETTKNILESLLYMKLRFPTYPAIEEKIDYYGIYSFSWQQIRKKNMIYENLANLVEKLVSIKKIPNIDKLFYDKMFDVKTEEDYNDLVKIAKAMYGSKLDKILATRLLAMPVSKFVFDKAMYHATLNTHVKLLGWVKYIKKVDGWDIISKELLHPSEFRLSILEITKSEELADDDKIRMIREGYKIMVNQEKEFNCLSKILPTDATDDDLAKFKELFPMI